MLVQRHLLAVALLLPVHHMCWTNDRKYECSAALSSASSSLVYVASNMAGVMNVNNVVHVRHHRPAGLSHFQGSGSC